MVLKVMTNFTRVVKIIILNYTFLYRFRNETIKVSFKCKFKVLFSLCAINADQTFYGGVCNPMLNSCAYPNGQCLANGVCGCEEGLTYNYVQGGCCKYFMVTLKLFTIVMSQNIAFIWHTEQNVDDNITLMSAIHVHIKYV